MAEVAGHKVEAMMQCGGGNLEIGIGEWQPKAVKLSVDIAAGARDGGQRPAAQNLGNGVGVEEKGHALTFERRRASRRRPAKLPNRVR